MNRRTNRRTNKRTNRRRTNKRTNRRRTNLRTNKRKKTYRHKKKKQNRKKTKRRIRNLRGGVIDNPINFMTLTDGWQNYKKYLFSKDVIDFLMSEEGEDVFGRNIVRSAEGHISYDQLRPPPKYKDTKSQTYLGTPAGRREAFKQLYETILEGPGSGVKRPGEADRGGQHPGDVSPLKDNPSMTVVGLIEHLKEREGEREIERERAGLLPPAVVNTGDDGELNDLMEGNQELLDPSNSFDSPEARALRTAAFRRRLTGDQLADAAAAEAEAEAEIAAANEALAATASQMEKYPTMEELLAHQKLKDDEVSEHVQRGMKARRQKGLDASALSEVGAAQATSGGYLASALAAGKASGTIGGDDLRSADDFTYDFNGKVIAKADSPLIRLQQPRKSETHAEALKFEKEFRTEEEKKNKKPEGGWRKIAAPTGMSLGGQTSDRDERLSFSTLANLGVDEARRAAAAENARFAAEAELRRVTKLDTPLFGKYSDDEGDDEQLIRGQIDLFGSVQDDLINSMIRKYGSEEVALTKISKVLAKLGIEEEGPDMEPEPEPAPAPSPMRHPPAIPSRRPPPSRSPPTRPEPAPAPAPAPAPRRAPPARPSRSPPIRREQEAPPDPGDLGEDLGEDDDEGWVL
jgi:hypothetical protein